MAQIESIMKSEIIRLTRRELRKASVPLKRDVRLLKIIVSEIRKASLIIEPIRSPETKRVTQVRNTIGSFTGGSKESPFFSTFE